IIQSALAPYGYTIKVRPMGNTRLVEMLEKGLIDIAPFAVIEAAGVYKSVEYITFFNVAVTKKNRNLKINSVADLAGLKVAAFQGATNVLGSEYKKIVTEEAELYREISKQKNQMKVFWKDRVDAVVLDKLIFDYRSFVTSETKNSPADVTYHTIFGKKTPFAAIFVDEKLRDEFNAGFKRIGASGELTGIYDSYLKPQ
ncbi:MAG: transporter substrate-binding domain-containing protein, partial [Rhodospirillales bacterium]|nr:transporter substrate-binding domain-containing protein [Rhodospirillales bacterium]